MTLSEMKLYWNVVNPISGCTLAQEIEIQKVIGGRLPYESQLSLIRRKIVTDPISAKTKKPQHSRAKKEFMNKFETDNSTNPTAESNDKWADRSTLPNHNLLLSRRRARHEKNL